MSHSDVPVAPVRRPRAAKRRSEAQPYEGGREKRRQRLGMASESGDEGGLKEEEEERKDDESARKPTSGLLSRLFSFFPIVGKLVAEDEAAVQEETSQEDLMGDEPILPHVTTVETLHDVVRVTVVDKTSPTSVENGVNGKPEKRSRSRSPARKSEVEVPTSPVRAAMRKRASATSPKTLGHAPEKAKALKIADAENQTNGRRRRSKPAKSAMESPLAVIKKRKPISLEEYERLSSQLRTLVEPTPDNALALTRTALTTALEGPAPSTTNDATAVRDRRELSVAALPAAKRARPHDEHPITLALPGSRNDLVSRKPKPSRLLTGGKRDQTARSAYSAAVAEKILSTLSKIQSPLDVEAQKPTPSTSLSWAKYHLALTEEAMPLAHAESSPSEELPPTATVPTIAFPSTFGTQAQKAKPVPSVFPTRKLSAAEVAETPISKPKYEGVTPSFIFSPPSTTPVAPVSRKAPVQTYEDSQTSVEFSFTLPPPSERVNGVMEDESIQYFFSPPSSLREPPKRAPRSKKGAINANSATPFTFVPASPKGPGVVVNKAAPPKPKPVMVKKPVVEMESAPALPAPTGVNPLARFMQLEAGGWKCPTCSVKNGPQHSKCPCCETDKPAAAATASTIVEPVKPAAQLSANNPLARFMNAEEGSWRCPTCAVMNGAKHSKCPCCETDKPGDSVGLPKPSATAVAPSSSAVSSAGFSFGVSASDSAKPATSSGPSFSFGVPKETDSAVKSADSNAGFSFGVTSSDKPVTASNSGFSFGAPSSDKPAATGGFSFGVAPTSSLPTEEKDVTSTKPETLKTPTFTFSGPPAVPSTLTAADPESSNKPSFSFGAGSSQKRKADSSEESDVPEKKAAPAAGFSFGGASFASSGGFSFGASAPDSVDTKPSTTIGFSFGTSAGKDSEPVNQLAVKKKPAPSFNGDAVKPIVPSFGGASAAPASTPAFSFGGAETKPAPATSTLSPEKKPAPAFGGFGSTTSTPITFGGAEDKPAATEKPKEATPPKPSFSFGTGGQEAAKPAGFGNAVKDDKPAFTFGSASATSSAFGSAPKAEVTKDAIAKPSFTFGNSPPSSAVTSPSTASKPAFTFGDASAKSPAAPAAAKPSFTFGSNGSEAPASAATTPAFGSSTSTPAFTFGGSAPSSKPAPPSTPATPAFTFGGSSQPATATLTTFGSTPAFGQQSAATSTGFGATTSGFGATSAPSPAFGMSTASSPASTPAAPAFSFGASQPAVPNQSQPFGFSASTAPSSAFSTPVSSAPSTTFGSSGSGFGGNASGVFGSTPSAGFGSTPLPSPAFGTSTPSTGFGATPSTGFGATPSSGFGAAPSTGFGATPSTGFGAPSASGFGAPALSPGFGAPTPSPSGFGAPTPSPSGFGAPTPSTFGTPAPTMFGNTPSPAFGAPASGFGAPQQGFGAPSTPGFGAPADGGFSMGAAPQAPKGRRILKAKVRPKRQ
ncbi:hypothetical protein Poli38472_003331 [Pythium oligandrum]|uniref:Nuclear pore complex protein Nup153 n=1 Tax=Pythium oligandrum TaxID=41045 RepID=A0A8K1FCP1_PYTOL|nr:hypothetical protein Poli38472_003331 [Pythium oligandrum]|eukprot:TMW57406.1 hypothetical protein Poli38472_003331 [Pythium oligandrum]